MKKYIGIIIVVTVVIVSLNQSNKTGEQEVINVSAAASLQGALSEIAANYTNDTNNLDISYGGSGTLVTQIQEGAPADIFISASTSNFENLKTTNEIVDETNLLNNNLVIIGKAGTDLSDLDHIDTIAIGTPEVVPAGTYAVQALQNLEVYDDVQDKLIQTKDVSEVVTYVETGNAQIGIVYSSDASNLENSDILYEFAANTHDEITYPIGLLTESKEAQAFYEYLQTDEAMQVFKKYGFIEYE